MKAKGTLCLFVRTPTPVSKGHFEMTKTPPSHATPSLLKWARRRARFSIEDAAQALSIDASRLQEWEDGNGTPSFAQLKKLAKKYKFPSFVFFLPHPPSEFTVVRDYRTIPGGSSRERSPELSLAIRTAQERQAWASDYIQSEGAEPPVLLASESKAKTVVGLADEIRKKLGVTIRQQVECVDDRVAFNLWRSACESLGIFVFQASKVPLAEMRGFALPDRYAPTIVLNSKDRWSARAFTLIHELAHIARGESAITGAGDNLFLPIPGKSEEQFCNSVAAETLVPAPDFQQHVPSNWDTDESIAALARRYHVSKCVIVFRLVETGFADKRFLQEKLRLFLSPGSTKKQEGGNIPQDTLAIARNGRFFSELAISAFHSGEIHGGALTNLLRVSMKHLNKIEATISNNRLQPVEPTEETRE